MAPQTKMPRIATTGKNLTLKSRCKSGLRTRRIQTPAHTRMNAKSVPMLVISPTMLSGRKAANSEVKTKNSMLDFHGVLNLGCGSEKIFGTKLSSLMEKKTRDWPYNMTRITEEKPARMATVTNFASHP